MIPNYRLIATRNGSLYDVADFAYFNDALRHAQAITVKDVNVLCVAMLKGRKPKLALLILPTGAA